MVKYSIKDLIQRGINELEKGDFNNPLLDVQLLLCFVLNVDRIYTYTHRDDIVESKSVDEFLELLEKRKNGYPLQYILKKQEFMGLDFYVDEGVLVPRPDTEILIESIINEIKNSYCKDNITILDIGTGSGAITLSLAHYIKNSFVYSIDISRKALEIAAKNADFLNLTEKVKFLEGDMLDKLGINFYNLFDIIVSNPPYIPSRDIDDLQVEVSKYEPRLALDGGEDGLDYYKRIINKANTFLKKNGLLALEIGYNQGEDLKMLLIENGNYKEIRVVKDLAGKNRVVLATQQF